MNYVLLMHVNIYAHDTHIECSFSLVSSIGIKKPTGNINVKSILQSLMNVNMSYMRPHKCMYLDKEFQKHGKTPNKCN